ncbi:hypothetical protein O3G_MSEX005899 [Manduca sexta]|uniref:Uncharacterized protein n=1 Tax=Manduca sexta TaxID=7130 RepID=A0A922CKF1_MANSE|nr:hypothetical protein O3G_MSEX005899 [Manduca sexta]
MDLIIAILYLSITSCNIQCLPISNGFTVKFNPLSVKEDVRPKSFGALFAKIPQESSPEATIRREMLSSSYIPLDPDLGPGCTNQIARIIYPYRTEFNGSMNWDNANVINLPIIKQSIDEYKILVAVAPPNVKIGGENMPTIVYIIFPEDDTNGSSSMKIPSVYFVNKGDSSINMERKQDIDPIFIVDSNRTVTGLKSREIAKFVKFRNKLINRYGYNVDN